MNSRILYFLDRAAEGLLYRNEKDSNDNKFTKFIRFFGSNTYIFIIKFFVFITFIFYDNFENTYISHIFKKDKYGIVILYAILSAMRYYEFFQRFSLTLENTKENTKETRKVTDRDVYFMVTCFRIIIFNFIFSFHTSEEITIQTLIHYLFVVLMIIVSYMGLVVFAKVCRPLKKYYLVRKIIIFIICFIIIIICGYYAAMLKNSANYDISDNGLNSRKVFNILSNGSESVLIIISL